MDHHEWRKVQKESFSKISDIVEFLELDEENRAKLLVRPEFPFLLPRRIAKKIEKNNLNGPVAKQFLPLKEELIQAQGFVMSPTCDGSFQKERKIIHKYQGRLLLIASGACAMHCRYCFRQNFSYPKGDSGFAKELEYIKNDPSLHEIILSGGDPLSLSDNQLESLLLELDAISHIQIIRFHTRFPMGIPERISPTFLKILKNSKKQIVFVIHANHFAEFDSDIFAALKSILSLGIPILLQTVLLRGVNDDIPSLKELFLNLSSKGIIPYYLHKLDQVKGTSHFEVPLDKGRFLIDELRKILPGYAVPRFAWEVPFKPYKTLL
jgi:EF-P beta-lysylation protein EpmB